LAILRSDIRELQADIHGLKKHQSVLLEQNKDVSLELEKFVQANDVIREKLDRKHRVIGMRQQNQG
jgi:regulator of replication initiation timing